jgi:hypothetical protein
MDEITHAAEKLRLMVRVLNRRAPARGRQRARSRPYSLGCTNAGSAAPTSPFHRSSSRPLPAGQRGCATKSRKA